MTRPTNRRQFLTTLGVATTGVVLAGCSGNGTEPPESTPTGTGGNGGEQWVQTNTVDMTDELTFDPERIEVTSGTTVTWENVGGIGHTVTAYEDEIPEGADYFASGGFDGEQAARDGYGAEGGGNIPAGETYEHTFETTGTYEYFCIPHELNGMVGTVRVV